MALAWALLGGFIAGFLVDVASEDVGFIFAIYCGLLDLQLVVLASVHGAMFVWRRAIVVDGRTEVVRFGNGIVRRALRFVGLFLAGLAVVVLQASIVAMFMDVRGPELLNFFVACATLLTVGSVLYWLGRSPRLLSPLNAPGNGAVRVVEEDPAARAQR